MQKPGTDWDWVVGDLGPRLYRYFCGSFSAAIAADLVQETLMRVLQKKREGRIDPLLGDLKQYSFGVARFVRLEQLSRRSLLDQSDDIQNFPHLSTQPGVQDSDPTTHLRWAIAQLGTLEQEVILLLIDSEYKIKDIAKQLHIPVSTVKSHIHRAKEKLRQFMEIPK